MPLIRERLPNAVHLFVGLHHFRELRRRAGIRNGELPEQGPRRLCCLEGDFLERLLPQAVVIDSISGCLGRVS